MFQKGISKQESKAVNCFKNKHLEVNQIVVCNIKEQIWEYTDSPHSRLSHDSSKSFIGLREQRKLI